MQVPEAKHSVTGARYLLGVPSRVEYDRRLRQRLDALGPAPRAELLHVLTLPDFERADRIGEFWGHPETGTFGELLIDLEEDRAYKAVVWGLLREMGRG